MAPHQHVLHHAHVHEDPHVLEGPRHPQTRRVGGGELRQFGVAEPYPAGRHLLEPADRVEQGRLPGTVGADEGGYAPLAALQRHLAHGLQTAEVHGHVLHPEQGTNRAHLALLAGEIFPQQAAQRCSTCNRSSDLRRRELGSPTGIDHARRSHGGNRRVLQRLALDLRPQPPRHLGPQAQEADRQEQEEKDHDDRVDGTVVLQQALSLGKSIDYPGHDDRAYDASPDGPVSPDEHHDDGKDRGRKGEVLWRHGAVHESEQAPGDATEHGVEHEGQEFPVRVADAKGRRGDLADGQTTKSPSHPVLEQPGQEQEDEDGDHPDEVILAHLGVERESEYVESLDRPETVRSAAPLPLEHDGKEYLAKGHGGQGKIEVLELEDRATHDQRNEPGGRGTGDPGQESVHMEMQYQQPAGVGAYAVEG